MTTAKLEKYNIQYFSCQIKRKDNNILNNFFYIYLILLKNGERKREK